MDMKTQYNDYLNEAFKLESKKNYSGALKLFNQAIVCNPDKPDGYMCKGGLLSECMVEYKESLACFDKVIEMNPPYIADAYTFKGLALNELGHSEEAKSYFKKSISFTISSNDARGYYHQARAFSMLGMENEAIENLKKAFSFNKEHYRKEDAIKEKAFRNLLSNHSFIMVK